MLWRGPGNDDEPLCRRGNEALIALCVHKRSPFLEAEVLYVTENGNICLSPLKWLLIFDVFSDCDKRSGMRRRPRRRFTGKYHRNRG